VINAPFAHICTYKVHERLHIHSNNNQDDEILSKKELFFFSGNWKLILHKTSAPRSISVNDDATIINQNYPKAGTQGTHRYYAQIPVHSL